MEIDCLWPGALHDAKIFADSEINQTLTVYVLPISYQNLLPGWTKVPFFLTGGSSLFINTISNESIYALYSQ